MEDTRPNPAARPRLPRPRWSPEKRAEALAAYYRTASRRRVRKETGVPERTLSAWLTDERYAAERKAVQAGILREVENEAARRGVEIVEATREAILVCRRALRGSVDGKTASSLLSALCRARESEDRIHRLDGGKATAINGVAPSAAEREAFLEWKRNQEELDGLTVEEQGKRFAGLLPVLAQQRVAAGDGDTVRELVVALLGAPPVVVAALAEEPALTRALREQLDEALQAVDVSDDVGSGEEGGAVVEWPGAPSGTALP